MRSCDMVIVVPVDKHTGNDEVLRLQAWGEVSELLRPGLGKLYRQFNPSGSAWERKYPRPFGVVLGRQEPELLAHGVWHILMQKGTPVPDCGIYYAALHRASATEEERREVIDHADEYAACMVVLSQGVKESA